MGRKLAILLILLLLVGLALAQTTINGSRSITGYWNAGGALWTIPFTVGTDAPATCQLGEVFFDSDAAAGFNLKLCTATDTWTLVQASGSGLGDMTKAEYDADDDSSVDRAETAGTATTAGSATALAANGANCSAGQAPLGVDASGAVEGCWTPSTGGATPAGAAGNVQYNLDGTALGAEAALTYDATTNVLTSGKFKVSDSCTLGAVTTAAAGTLCWGGVSGLLASDGSNWYTAIWVQDATGEIWYSNSNYGPTTSAGFSYASSILTVPIVKPTTSIRGTASNVINLDPDSDGTMEANFDASGNFSGLAGTATALAANGANCSAGQAPLGVDASGAVESCWTPGTGNMSTATYDASADGTVDSAAYATSAGTAGALSADGTNCSSGQAPLGVDASGNAQGCWTPTGTTPNIWSTIDVDGTGDVAPDSTADTLTITAGTGITISGTAASDTITITNSSPASGISQVDIDGDGTREIGQSGSYLVLDPDEDGTNDWQIGSVGIISLGVTGGSFSSNDLFQIATDADEDSTGEAWIIGGRGAILKWDGALGDCDGDGSALGYDITTGNLVCGDDDTGGAGTQVDIDGDGTREISLASTAMSIDPDENGTAELTIDASGNFFRWDINNDGTSEFSYDADGTPAFFCMDPDDNGNCDFQFVDYGSDASPQVGIAFHGAAAPTLLHIENQKLFQFDLDEEGTSELTIDGSLFEVRLDPNSDGTTDTIFNQTYILAEQIRFSTSSAVRSNSATGGLTFCGGNQFAPHVNAGGCFRLGQGSEDEIYFDPDGDGTVEATISAAGAYSGLAGSATVLASDPTDCGANTWATTIANSGNLTCSAISGGAGVTDGTILEADLTWQSTATRTAGQGIVVGSDTTKFDVVTLMTESSSNTLTNKTYDAGGTGNVFTLEDGTGVSAASAGQIKIDTTANQLVYYGGAAKVIDPRQTLAATLMAPADADTPLIFKAPYGMTITDIDCIVGAATSAVIDIQECTSAGASCATVDATITCDTDGAADDGTLSNGSIDAGDWIKLDMGTVTGTVGFVSVTITYTITQE